MTRIEEVTYSVAGFLGEVSDAYLAANNLNRGQWETMVAKELAKMNPTPRQTDLFA